MQLRTRGAFITRYTNKLSSSGRKYSLNSTQMTRTSLAAIFWPMMFCSAWCLEDPSKSRASPNSHPLQLSKG